MGVNDYSGYVATPEELAELFKQISLESKVTAPDLNPYAHVIGQVFKQLADTYIAPGVMSYGEYLHRRANAVDAIHNLLDADTCAEIISNAEKLTE